MTISFYNRTVVAVIFALGIGTSAGCHKNEAPVYAPVPTAAKPANTPTSRPTPKPTPTPSPAEIRKRARAARRQKREQARLLKEEKERQAQAQAEAEAQQQREQVATEQREIEEARYDGVVSMDEYEKISTGMSYSEVIDIISSGKEISRSDMAGYTTVMYMWQNDDGSNMNAMFQNDASDGFQRLNKYARIRAYFGFD